jgi:hypothetical protein
MNKKLINEDIKNMKYLFGYKPGRVISEQDGMWTQTTTMDRLDPIDEPMDIDDEGSVKSILKKHNLLDNVDIDRDIRIFMKGESSEVVQKLLSLLHLFDKLIFLAIVDCDSADFSDVDMCSLPELTFINLTGTENNFNEQGYECFDDEGNGMYFHKDGK